MTLLSPRTGVTKSQTTSEWWREIGRDRRFWALVVMVIAINIIWHITRAWLTKFLQQGRNYSESDALLISSAFYALPPMWSYRLLSGGAALWLARPADGCTSGRGFWVFGICSMITGLTSVLVLLPKGLPAAGRPFRHWGGGAGIVSLLLFIYAGTGSETRGQGHGVAFHHRLVGGASPLQKYFGKLVDQTHSFDLGISLIGWVPCLALITMLLFWRTAPKPDTL